MIKRWGKFIVVGVVVGIIYIAFNNYNTLWDMVLNIPVEVIISYVLGGLTMYYVIFGKKIHRKKKKQSNQPKESES